MLDPELFVAAAAQPKYDFSDPIQVRRKVAKLSAALRAADYWRADEAVVQFEDLSVRHDDTATAVGIRIYRPQDVVRPAPVIIFFHGGGFMIGDLDYEHSRCLKWARGASSIVISCNYRLSPENRFPAALNDCYQCLCWAAAHCDELGIDANRIAVAGSSCGGALAAGTALLSRDRSGPSLAFQLLNYPVLDDRMTTISMSEHTDTPGWDRISTEHMWRHYLGPQADGASAYAAPARMDRLAGLPQTYIMTAEMDPLRDEGLIYAGRLLQAGVSVEVHNLAGTFHGFDSIESSQLAKQALAEQISAFQRVFRSSCPSRALGK